ncbi:MAG TPA: adenine deaminase [Thermomicrobiales bacterium]|nr:adenine deaminase [Thermomicrobiales bacterium]
MTETLERWQRAIRIARLLEPAELCLRGGTVVNVFTGELEPADVAIADGRIVGVGDYPEARESIDVHGAILAPSFVDGHIHTESSLLWITQFARAVVPHGAGAIVTDPHEIVNVAGLAGFEALVAASRDLPIDIRFTVPSCVPASPFETAGAVMTPESIAAGLTSDATVGLGELMSFPGVLAGDPEIYERLRVSAGRLRDGHAPGLRGHDLDAYALSGITSDHESTQVDEAREKLRRGIFLMLREGSSAHNALDLLPLVDDATWPRCCFASDDRDCAMLLEEGHMDATLRKVVAAGLDPIRAIQMSTITTATYWRLDGIGAIAPGYRANIVVLDDLTGFNVASVYYRGARVAHRSIAEFDVRTDIPDELRNSVHIPDLTADSIRLPADKARVAVGAIDGQIVTELREVEPELDGDLAVPAPDRDLLKLVCVERHNATGNVGVGYVQGFGLRSGALASSIAHDAHNIVAVGASDEDILAAVRAVAETQGGLAVVQDGRLIDRMPLPVAGILSDQPLEVAAETYERLERRARDLGSTLHSPFGLLAFLALSVIPEARVTDQGFVVV